MDATLFFFATILLLTGLALLAIYIWTENGSIFDPVAVFWGGFIMYVPVAMLGVAFKFPGRATATVAVEAAALAVAGTVMYILGLYSGKARGFVASIPIPAPTFGPAQLIAMWIFTISMVAFSLTGSVVVGQAWSQVVGALVNSNVGAAALLSVLGFFMFRGNPIARLFMVAGFFFIIGMLIVFSWSRRPQVGLVLAAFGFIYVFRMRNSGAFKKGLLLISTAAVAGLLLLYLGATRGNRFYGSAAGAAYGIFSSENFADFIGGLDINYYTYEFAVQRIPREREFLWGSGYVTAFLFFIPRAIWESKPVSSGSIISRMWYSTNYLENNLGIVPFGELYMNFTAIGVILGMWVSGRVVRILNTYLRQNPDNMALWLAWLVCIPDLATIWRGDFTAMYVSSVTKTVLFLGLAWVSSTLFPSPKKATPPSMAPVRTATPPPGAAVRPPTPWVPGYRRMPHGRSR
ncbi:MAG: hypothetical protein SF069_02670 [Phycisphaerae bacterium]|nr:hypothetical protein [Phycisphaerae bacterium]